MSRTPRDREAERSAIQAAAGRLLAGTPLYSAPGKLTATRLITESRLRRGIVYQHRGLVEDFKARAAARSSLPGAAARQLVTLGAELAGAQVDHARERETTAMPASGEPRRSGLPEPPAPIGERRRGND